MTQAAHDREMPQEVASRLSLPGSVVSPDVLAELRRMTVQEPRGAADFDESKHPRDDRGRWTRGYHVTRTSSVGSIRRTGITQFNPTNWVKAGSGDRYGGGEIFAFEHEADAVAWAAKMDWANQHGLGTGEISVVEFDPHGWEGWEVDESDPLSQAGSAGRWFKKHGRVGPADIGRATVITKAHVQQLIRRVQRRDVKLHPEPRDARAWDESKHPRDERGRWTAAARFDTVEAANSWGAKTQDWADDMTESQKMALGHYTTFVGVNSALRRRNKAGIAENMDVITGMDALMAHPSAVIQEDLVIHRAWRGAGPNKPIGTEFIDHGYASCALVERETEPFKDTHGEGMPSIDVEIRVPKGARGLYVGVDSRNPDPDKSHGTSARWYASSSELILNRGTRYRIIDRIGGGKRPRKIVLEVVL